MKNDVAHAAGPLLVTYLVNWGFQGVLCVQVYKYYRAFPRDRCFLKILVYGVFILEVIQSALMTRDAFDTFVTGFAKAQALNEVRALWLTLPVLGGIVALICRLFLIYRLYVLSKSWIPALPAIVLATIAVVAALLTGVKFAAMRRFMLARILKHHLYALVGLWNGSSAACDIYIAACMVHYLLRQKANFKHTLARITRLVVAVVETGIFTATISTLSFLLFLFPKQTSYFAVPTMIAAKLYSNTMLIALNNRILIAGGRGDQETGSEYPRGIQDMSQWEPHDTLGAQTPARGNIGVRDSTSMDQFGPQRNEHPKIMRPAPSFYQK